MIAQSPAAVSICLDFLFGVSLCVFVSVVPQQGQILITTEFGKMLVEPNEICVIQVRLISLGQMHFWMLQFLSPKCRGLFKIHVKLQ